MSEYTGEHGSELRPEAGNEIPKTAEELWQELPQEAAQALDRAGNAAGLPEDLTGFIELFKEEHDDDTALVDALRDLTYIVEPEARTAKAEEIIKLLN